MDDRLSTTLGFIGLTGLLSNCIEYFELVQADGHHSVVYEIFSRKFQAQWVKLITWGMATGIIGARDYDTSLAQSRIYTAIHGLLAAIERLFENGDDLVHKYGLIRTISEAESSDSHIALQEPFERFRQHLRQGRPQVLLEMETRWAIADGCKFRQLVADITKSVDAIQNLTQSAGTLTRQQEILQEQIELARAQGNIEALVVLQEAALEAPTITSRRDAANQTLANAEAATTEKAHTPSAADIRVHQPSIPLSSEATLQNNQTQLDRFAYGLSHASGLLQARDETMAELISADNAQLSAGSQEPLLLGLTATRRIIGELRAHIRDARCPYISMSLVNNNLGDVLGIVRGPLDSPYHGGIFFVRMRFPYDYPMEHPVVRFLTKVYHPNISEEGRLCVFNKAFWLPALGIQEILLSLSALLSSPIPDEPLRADVAEQFLGDRATFNTIAAAYTRLYATGERPRVYPTTAECSCRGHTGFDLKSERRPNFLI